MGRLKIEGTEFLEHLGRRPLRGAREMRRENGRMSRKMLLIGRPHFQEAEKKFSSFFPSLLCHMAPSD